MTRKTWLVSLLLFSFALSIVFVSGCGQVTPQIYESQKQPANLTIRGTVYSRSVSGFIASTPQMNLGKPIAGAIVGLYLGEPGSTSSPLHSTVTNANGEYAFTGMPDGIYSLVATSELYPSVVNSIYYAAYVTIKPYERVAADNTITTADLYLDDVPIPTGITPIPGSVISNNQSFVMTFNKPMDTSSVRFAFASTGPRTTAVNPNDTGDTVQLDLTWSADKKSVTISPVGGLISNEVYKLGFSPGDQANYNNPPYDQDGHPLFPFWWNKLPWHTYEQDTRFSNGVMYYRVNSGGVASAPSNLCVMINGKQTSEVDCGDVIPGANLVGLSWKPSSSGCITGYKIYAAREGSVLNYSPLESDGSTATSTANNYFTSNITKVINALYGTGTNVSPVGEGNYPFINTAVHFKVVAFNGDGESAAAEIMAKDSVGPGLSGHSPIPITVNTILPDNTILPPLPENTSTYIVFNELIDPSTIVAGNFSLNGGLTVTSVVFIKNVDAGGIACFIKLTGSGNLAGRTLTVSGVKDMAGNPVVTGTLDTLLL